MYADHLEMLSIAFAGESDKGMLNVTVGACKTLAWKMPRLNVEIFNESEQADCYMEGGQRVEKIYLYRTVAGKREDAPEYLSTL
ncbi:protein auxin signaling F-box 2-like, partial [Trifolium pratense]